MANKEANCSGKDVPVFVLGNLYKAAVSNMSRLTQLGRDSVIYGLGGVLAKGIGFFLLPVYTRIFTPADYGTIEMLTVVAGFVSTILAMGMDSTQSFYFFRERDRGTAAQVQVVSAIFQLRLLWGGGIVILATLFAPLLNAWLFHGALTWDYFAMAFACGLLGQVMGQSIDLFRLLYRPWPYILISAAYALLSAGAVLVLVLGYDQGIWGYFLGSLLGALVLAVFSAYLIREYLDLSRFFVAWWPRLVRFGLPLLPAGIAFSIMSTGDRWFIQHYHGDTVLGIYAVGAKFALLITLAIETFRKAWWPMAMDAMHSDDGPETFRMIARLYMGFGVAGLVQLTWLSPWLVDWFAGPGYNAAWPLVGVLTWQSLFYGFYLVVSAGIWKAEKTYLAMYLMLGAAILNGFLNYLLVPAYAGMGAAIATAIAYACWIGASMALSEQLWRVGFPVATIAFQAGAGILFVAWYLLFFDSSPALLKAVVAFFTSAGLILVSLNPAQRMHVVAVLRAGLRRRGSRDDPSR